jgi:ABC-type dipeptide/oligopeptide/nickel transport system ATPase subunit
MVEVSDEAMLFVTNEILVVHTLCDRAQVPRLIDGETLTMAQRVAILEGVQRGLTARLGMEHPVIIH